ncbi:MAG: AbrB/MazE/SpoVT family DNA-binding domain-containing protein [Candidatus Aenigmarchaeota archaeon]|nr:AbrB/MazE/SpoVT family DNA-binding domain-containing protein [Candidatus Aenigmarchaeota archaeon]
MGISKITRNYQVTLSSDVREPGFKMGDKVVMTRSSGKIIIEKLDKRGIVARTAGVWKSKGSGIDYVREMRKKDEERFKRLGL